MKKEKTMNIILSVMCMLALVACGASTSSSLPSSPAVPNPPDSSSMNTPDGNIFDATGVEIRGSVVEFSDDFCVISPMENGADEHEGIEAAPGHEDPEKNITIHYQEGCVIQIAEINVISGERNLVDAAITDIKKQTSLIVYGEWADEHNLNATTVYIARFQS